MTPDHLGQVLGAVPLPVIALDEDARVIQANEAAEALFGPIPQGRPFVAVIRHPEVNAAAEAVVAGGGRHMLRATLQTRASKLPCRVTLTPLEVGGRRATAISIEDRSSDEESGQMRRDFVANVSHELRTPLTALMGFIETLQGPARGDPAAHERFLTIMGREAGRMNRLIGELLSLSRVEQDERLRPVESVDIAALLRSVVTTLAPSAEKAGVRIEPTGTEGAVILPGDADQLVQVFHNLIENAVKYGGSGGVVRVGLERVEHEPVLRGPALMVTVADEGEGIEHIHLPRLTERFYRVDTHRSREKGGTGLGLAIVKHIVNRHRGRLRIESERGKGSSFIVLLPEKLPKSN